MEKDLIHLALNFIFATEIFGGLWCCTDEAYNFVFRVMPKKRRRTKNAIPYAESIIMEFIADVACKSRKKLASRMAINLEVEAMAGRAKESAKLGCVLSPAPTAVAP